MPAKKGTRPPNAGKGRKKGVPNKHRLPLSTREALVAFVHRNANDLQVQYDRVKKKHPAVAVALFAKIAEFVEPKLHRTELSADVNHHGLPSGPMVTVSDPVEAARLYQQMIEAGKGGKPAPRVDFVSAWQPPPTSPTPKQEYLPAPWAQSHVQPQESAPTPRIVAAEPDDTGVSNTEDEPTNVVVLEPHRYELAPHEHRPIADSRCGFCRKMWIQQ
jgi:hypothetical protein